MGERRFWSAPGLAGQFGILLLAALLVSNLLAMLFLQRTGDLLHPISRAESLQRLKLAYRVVQDVPPSQAAALNASMSSPATRVEASARAEVAPLAMQPQERGLAGDLRHMLGLPDGTEIRMQLERVDGSPARENVLRMAGWAPLRLRSSIRLPDGRWLNVVQHPVGSYEWGRLLGYTLPVSVIPVLLVSWLFVRRLTRPIRRLAQAAEQARPGRIDAPLPLHGPREARELTAAFNALQERVARHVEGRMRMLAMVGHDFATPITELRLMLELMPPSPQRQDMLDSLADLQGMVREALAFLRDDARQEPQTDFDPTQLLEELQRRYARLGAPVVWSCAGRCALRRGRPLALKRALMNLIDNGLRHGGKVHVQVMAGADGQVRIEVCDDGEGIAEAMLEQVFEPFVRLGTAAAGAAGQGVGLGLAIARACVRAQGGEVTLENRADGFAAVVRLPGSVGAGDAG